MEITEIQNVHEYIKEFDLLAELESVTKKNWMGSGSRATYYNAVKKSLQGEKLSLVEGLMMLEAGKLVKDHAARQQVEA